MGVIKAESEINIAEMSNVSSFLAICLERLRTTTGRTSQTDPIPPKTWLRYEPRTTLCTKISRSSVQISYSDSRRSQSLSTVTMKNRLVLAIAIALTVAIFLFL
jgi:uncharacterized lipoprotein YajG